MTLPTYNQLRSDNVRVACPDCGSRNTTCRVGPGIVKHEDGREERVATIECRNCGLQWPTAYTPPRSR